MGKKQVWVCDWCGLMADWSQAIERSWFEWEHKERFEDGRHLLCPSCYAAYSEGIAAAHRRITAKKEGSRS